MNGIRRVLIISSLAVGMLLPIAPSALAAPVAPISPDATYQVVETIGVPGPVTALASWVPWDGFHITTYANCQARRSYLIQVYHLIPSMIKCQKFECAPDYWMIMVLQGAIADQGIARREVMSLLCS